MIKTEKIPDGKQWSKKIAQYCSQGMKTNFYGTAEDCIFSSGKLYRLEFEGGCFLFHEKENQIDLYYFSEKDAILPALPAFSKPLIWEQVATVNNPPDCAQWESLGFKPYLLRKRLTLPAKKTDAAERKVVFAEDGDVEEILTLMKSSFEPYTSALPDAETLRSDIAEKRVIVSKEDDKLLGFLRYGREKKVSVLWQIAVSPEAGGKKIGTSLVKDWLFLERAESVKFQLWVREDNPIALKLYENSGFLPDGRIALVMIKICEND